MDTARPSSQEDSRAPSLVKSDELQISSISNFRKWVLLFSFSIAQFLDVTNISMLFSAIPTISGELGLSSNESVWLISAYQLTFASFLLLSGRLSDIYNPKTLFNTGFAALGIFSLIAGFIRNKIGLIVLRAFSGIAGAITIPSALNLIVHLFPEPAQQARALSIFGSVAALGNVLGLILGSIFVQYATWPWLFYLTSILAIPIAIACIILIPKINTRESEEPAARKAKGLDVVGVSTLTIALILLIYALTTGPENGWATGGTLAPLIISVFMVVGFFVYETKIPEDQAALPPKIWFYPNFGVLFGVALIPFPYWVSNFLIFTPLWQEVYHWSPILVGVRFLPMGILSFITMIAVSQLQSRFRLKPMLLFGAALAIIGSVLLPFANSPSRYWSFVFPAISIGSIGTTILFVNANIAMFKFTPPSMAGTVGAIFNSALQLGSAVGIAAISSVQTSVQDRKGGFTSFDGRAAGFWFLLGLVLVLTISIIIFMKDSPVTPPNAGDPASDSAGDSSEKMEEVTEKKVVRKDLSAA